MDCTSATKKDQGSTPDAYVSAVKWMFLLFFCDGVQLHEHREFCVLCRFGAVKSVSLKVRSVQRPNRNVLLFPGSIETVLFASLCIYCLING